MGPRAGRSLLLLFALAWPVGSARAQVLFEQDFEAPGSDAPPHWSQVVRPAGVLLQRDARAAAMGDAGLYVQRLDGGSTGPAHLVMPADGGWRQTVYARTWLRVGRQGAIANLYPFQVMASAVGAAAEAQLRLEPDGGLHFGVAASHAPNGAQVVCPTVVPFDLDAWHLLEVVAQDLATDAGTLRGALDGQLVCEAGANWPGLVFTGLRVGSVSGSPATVPLDLDGVRVSTVPMASGLDLRTWTDGGVCVEVRARPRATFDGGLVPRGYAARWTVHHDGGARLGPCPSQTGVVVTLSAGLDSVVARVVPEGELVMRVDAEDLVGSEVSLSGPWLDGGAEPEERRDAGVPQVDAGEELPPVDGPQALQVGCDCHAAPGGLLAAAAVALARLRRRGRTGRRG